MVKHKAGVMIYDVSLNKYKRRYGYLLDSSGCSMPNKGNGAGIDVCQEERMLYLYLTLCKQEMRG